MPPTMQRFGGGPNSMSQYGHYAPHTQAHANLPPPALSNPQFMNPNSNINPFANGNALSLGQSFGGGAGNLGMGAGTGLASHAAQMSFAHGANLQQQAHNVMADHGARTMPNKGRIRDVWKTNLHEEMESLRRLVDKYPIIAMDTEFPGVVARPMGQFRGKSDYHYQTMRSNVDLLKVIQIGITLFTEDGDPPPARNPSQDSAIDVNMPGTRKAGNNATQNPCTWQFNFRFSLKDEMYAQGSIESLQAAGLDFAGLERDGIDPFEFGALLISSGLVCDEDVKWVSFHGGYDFGYLTKIMTCKPLPDDEYEFDNIMKKFFPSIYDVKYLMKHASRLQAMGQITPMDPASTDILQKFEQKGSLENLAEILKVKRIGTAHQSGSDALLTGRVFFAIRERIYNGEISNELLNKVWGLGYEQGTGAGFAHSTPQHYHRELNENNGNGTNGTPSTPNNGHAGLANNATPAPSTSSVGTGGIGPMTPGGGGGVFGAFQFAKS